MEGTLQMVHETQAWLQNVFGVDGEILWTGLQWLLAILVFQPLRAGIVRTFSAIFRAGPFSVDAMHILDLLTLADNPNSRWELDPDNHSMSRGLLTLWYKGKNKNHVRLHGGYIENTLTRRERKAIKKAKARCLAQCIATRKAYIALQEKTKREAALARSQAWARDVGLALPARAV